MSATRHLLFLCTVASLAAQTPVAEQPAAAPAPAVSAEASRLAETEDKLSTALRSFSLLQNENDRQKADIQRLTDEGTALKARLAESTAQITTLQEQLATASATASQVEILRTQLRQTQDQMSALTVENVELRNRLAITAAAPGSVLGVPSRPGTVIPTAITTPAPTADLKTPEPRYHNVIEGDTLSKIARQYYGDSKRWPEILEANKSQLTDERSLRFGLKLKIP